MANKFTLNCFFCGKEISAIIQTETRHRHDHECSSEYTVEVIIPAESNICTVEFKPAYILPKEDIQKAEEETQKIIAQATAAGDAALKPYLKKLDGVELSVREQGWSMQSPGESRVEKANRLYGLKTDCITGFLSYRIKDFDIRPEGFKAHRICIKKELTLEELVKNPLVNNEFKQSFASLPQPYQKIYNKLKSKKVNVIMKEFDLRDYLK